MKLKLISFMFSKSGDRRNIIILTMLLAGVANGIVMLIINDVSKDFNEVNIRNLLLFVLCITTFVFARRFSEYHAQTSVQQAISDKHLNIVDKIRKSSLAKYEKIGKISIITNITENSQIIYESSRMLVHSLTASVMLTVSFLYILYLSTAASLICIVVLSSGIFIYKHEQKKMILMMQQFQEKDSEFFNTLNHILNGIKEVKINSNKSDDLYTNEFKRNIDESLSIKFKAENKIVTNMVFGQSMFFFLMACIVFLLPQIDDIDSSTMMSVTAIVLFISGAIGLLIEAIPIILKAEISLQNIENLEILLTKAEEERQQPPSNLYTDFNEISTNAVEYAYLDNNANSVFTIGPIDSTFKRGEITFIVGGNGSGKTTYIKNIAGLYFPSSGNIKVDQNLLLPYNYTDYRNLFSLILADFHLFDKLYGLGHLDEKKVNRLLKEMQVDHKTQFMEGRFTNLDLSTGQRKRIALIVALLEDKPIMIFDEVAADQDPEFRDYYYRTILPSLKRSNKTIIAVSHDDRYFDLADKLIKLDCGQVIERRG